MFNSVSQIPQCRAGDGQSQISNFRDLFYNSQFTLYRCSWLFSVFPIYLNINPMLRMGLIRFLPISRPKGAFEFGL